MRAIAWIRVDGTVHKGCPGVDEPLGWTPLYEIEVGDKVHRRGVEEKGSEYAKHEVLDRVNLFAQMIGLFLLEDELVRSREDLHGPIQVAHDSLMEVYQALGVEHLLPKHFDEEEGEQGMPVPVGEVKEYFDQQVDAVDQLISQLPMLAVPGAAMPEVRPFPTFDQPVIPSNTITPEITAQRRQAEKAQCWDDLMEACGHWQDGTDRVVKLIQDETVRECGIYVKEVGREQGPAFWGKTFKAAVRVMKEARG